MKPSAPNGKLLILSMGVFLTAFEVQGQRQAETPPAPQEPAETQPAEQDSGGKKSDEPKKKPLRIDPMADPLKELARRARDAAEEKNYNELKEAAAELAALTKKMSDEINDGGRRVISARIFEDLDRVEKLAKKMRDRAKGP